MPDMHDAIAGYVERGEVPGVVTLISRRGEVRVDSLGMKATAFSMPKAKLDRLATCYQTDPTTGRLVLFDEAAAVGGPALPSSSPVAAGWSQQSMIFSPSVG